MYQIYRMSLRFLCTFCTFNISFSPLIVKSCLIQWTNYIKKQVFMPFFILLYCLIQQKSTEISPCCTLFYSLHHFDCGDILIHRDFFIQQFFAEFLIFRLNNEAFHLNGSCSVINRFFVSQIAHSIYSCFAGV